MSGVYHTRWETGTTKRQAMDVITIPPRKLWIYGLTVAMVSSCATGGELGRRQFPELNESGDSDRSQNIGRGKISVNLRELVYGPDWLTVVARLHNDSDVEILVQPNAILFFYQELEYPPEIQPSLTQTDNELDRQIVSQSLPTSAMLQMAKNSELKLELRYQVGREIVHKGSLIVRGLFAQNRWLDSISLEIPVRGATAKN